ncbi:hypothetical protein [Paenibacillus sp. WLX2291]|uniref:hypothetical protein n=1 Tax=Paenibacillus sp. WLX2291 TaxID=3296934 RepID=UPI003983F309
MEKTTVWSVHGRAVPDVTRSKAMSTLPMLSSLLPAVVIVLLHVIHMLIVPALASSMVMMEQGSMEMNGSGMSMDGMSGMNHMDSMDHSGMSHMSDGSTSSAIPWMEIVMGAIWIISIVSIVQAGYQLWTMLRSKQAARMNYVCAGFSLISLGVAVYSIVVMIG